MHKITCLSMMLVFLFSRSPLAQSQESWTTFTAADGLADNYVNTICQSNDGVLWFGTNGGGISRYEHGIWTTFTTADGLANNIVTSIDFSITGALWIGTYDGINCYHDGLWNYYTTLDGLINNRVNVVYGTTDGSLWVGTSGGVSRFQDGIWQSFTTVDGIANNRVNTIIESDDGAMWIGTDNGISYYKDGTWKSLTINIAPLITTIQTIYESDSTALWFGTRGGVVRYYDNKWTLFTKGTGLADNWVYAIFESDDKALWVATRAGLSRYYNESWNTFTETDGLANNWIRAIVQGQDRALWFGSYGGGVSRYEINTPYIVITYPNTTGIFWFHNRNYPITWNSSGDIGSYLNIELLKGGKLYSTIDSDAANNGIYDFHVPFFQVTENNYKIKISAVTNASIYDISDYSFGILATTDVAQLPHSIYHYKLYPCYPNPFNASTKVQYEIPRDMIVDIKIYNILGAVVKVLVSDQKLPGFYEVLWDGTNDHKHILPNGIYILTMKAGDYFTQQKMTLLK